MTVFLAWNKKRGYFEECFSCFCPYNEGHWGPKQYCMKKNKEKKKEKNTTTTDKWGFRIWEKYLIKTGIPI